MSLQPGEIVEGKYRIVRVIGEGGMGSVYEGENTRINRRVAIKVLHQAYTGNEEVLRRFEREAQAAGHIGNDHILEVLDLGSLPNGDYFMVMEFLDGEPLSSLIQRSGRLSPTQLAPLAKQLLRGLGAAHRAGIVHRDLKPDNVFVLREKAGVRDFVKIIDFGISKFQPLSGDGMKMTRTGAVMGTPYYMSPEQASGSKEADARSDIYSVGVILYEAVTGRVPFDASTFNQLMFKIVLADIPPPQSVVPDLDPAFATLVLKSMARDVSHRFQSAEEFIQAIEAWETRGVAVSIPPPDAGASNLVPTGDDRAKMLSSAGLDGPQRSGDQRIGTGTPGTWAQDPIVVPKKSAGPLIAVLAVVGVVGLAGGVGLFLAFGGKPSVPEPATPPSAATPADTPPSPPPPASTEAIDAGAPEPALDAAATEPSSTPSPVGVPPAGTARPTPAVTPPVTPPKPPGPARPPKPPTGVDFGY